MQLRRLLFLGLLLGAEGAQLVKRQSAGSSAAGGNSTPASNEDTSAVSTAPGSGATQSSPSNNNASTGGGNSGGGGGSTSTPANDGDTTVTKTTTVSDGGGSAASKTTVFTTITSTVTIGVTEFQTTTVTSSDGDTATTTVYETTTEWANQKRALNLAPRTLGPEGFQVDAQPTDVPTVTQINLSEVELIRHKKNRRGSLHKRATITEIVTVTAGGKGGKVSTVTNTVISTVSTETKTTSLITETVQANAKTTVTTTSTLTVTSTAVTTGVLVTTTAAPSGAYGNSGTGVPDSGNGKSDSGSKGLSTGAKAGIGAGCGVVGLALLGGLLWFLLRKRRNGPKAEHDDMFGSSEVPVGRNSPPPVSQHNRDAAAAIIAPRRAPTKPNSPEGYRGTALGDGRAGFAKPEAFGSAYSAVSPETQYTRTTASTTPHPDVAEMHSPANTAELSNDSSTARWHDSNAAEIDGSQVTRPTGSGPPPNVYEMPAQDYR